jgi:hypothetical protein
MAGYRFTAVVALLLGFGASSPAPGQERLDPSQPTAAQQEALGRLSFMDGVWRGPAWTISPSGEKSLITQTERIGSLMERSVKVIQRRGYDVDGNITFNAFGTISYNPATRAYTIHSYAQGVVGDLVLTPTADGFTWEFAAGAMTIRYTWTVKDGAWREVGDRIMPGEEPIRFFEMNLTRVGETPWGRAAQTNRAGAFIR